MPGGGTEFRRSAVTAAYRLRSRCIYLDYTKWGAGLSLWWLSALCEFGDANTECEQCELYAVA